MAVSTLFARRVGVGVASRTASVRDMRPATALVVSLLVACAYAVFAKGAIGLPEEPRLQIGLAAVSIAAAAVWLFSDAVELRARREAWIGVALLAGFATWCGLTLLWSVAPDRTWAELNRGLAYTLVVLLGIAVGSSAPRALERIAVGWLVIAVATAMYALAGKIVPGLHVLGIDFNHTALVSRLRAPVEYWNALALVCAMGVPVALRLTTDVARDRRVRLAGLGSVFLLLGVVGMTYSRGGFVAITAILVVMTVMGGGRLRGLVAFSLAAVATVPVLYYSFSRVALIGNGVPLEQRISDGRILGLVVLGSLGALLAAGRLLLGVEDRVLPRWSPERSAAVWRRVKRVSIVLGILVFLNMAARPGGIPGVVERGWDGFTKTSQDKISDPVRLTSSNSGNRWVWWQEAGGVWSDRPIAGWGAGSFGVTHKLYRDLELGVTQPHNVPLQFLAETGIIGALLALSALGYLLVAALRRVRDMAIGRERDIAVALLAAGCAWVVHGLYDWDWDIPAVSVPALLFLGVLVARPRSQDRGTDGTTARSPAPASPSAATLWAPAPGPGAAGRAVALGAVCLLLALVAVSAALPSWADSRASDAYSVSATASPAELESAAARAELGAKLDPTSVRSLLAASSLAEGRGRLVDAREYVLQAVDRQPYNETAWLALGRLAILTADRRGAEAAARRLLEIDPIGNPARRFAARLALFRTPAGSSPTATGTPLSPGFVVPDQTALPQGSTPAPTTTGTAQGSTPAPTTTGSGITFAP